MKELIASYQLSNDEHLVLVKWHGHGWAFVDDDWQKADEYIVAYVKNLDDVTNGKGWFNGAYLETKEEARKFFISKLIK